MSLWLLPLLAVQAEVGVVVPPDADRSLEFSSLLSNEVDVLVTIRTSSVAFDEALAGDFPDVPESLLVLLDPRRPRVVVARRSDGTVFLRSLRADGSSTYAMAVAAAELVRVAMVPPPKRGEPLRTTTRRVVEDRPLDPALYLGTALGVTESFGHEPLVVEPRVVLGLELLDVPLGLFSRIGVGLRAPVASSRANIVYERWGPSIVLAAGWRGAWGRVGGRFEAGVARTQATALAPDGAVEGQATRSPAWAGVGPFAEIDIALGLSAVLDGGLGWSASPADYFVRGAVPLTEGRMRWNAAIGVAWRWQGR